jgi:hypothetical protein
MAKASKLVDICTAAREFGEQAAVPMLEDLVVAERKEAYQEGYKKGQDWNTVRKERKGVFLTVAGVMAGLSAITYFGFYLHYCGEVDDKMNAAEESACAQGQYLPCRAGWERNAHSETQAEPKRAAMYEELYHRATGQRLVSEQ